MGKKNKSSAKNHDAVDMLLRQHDEIRQLFTDVRGAAGPDRQEMFDKLCQMLAVHEAAEEQAVHPAARQAVRDGNGTEIVNARLHEEDEAKHMLADLERLGADSPEFLPRLDRLRDAVLAHAEREEREEFPQLRAHLNGGEKKRIAAALGAAAELAPTHTAPHTDLEDALAGQPSSTVAERASDVTRDALHQHGG